MSPVTGLLSYEDLNISPVFFTLSTSHIASGDVTMIMLTFCSVLISLSLAMTSSEYSISYLFSFSLTEFSVSSSSYRSTGLGTSSADISDTVLSGMRYVVSSDALSANTLFTTIAPIRSTTIAASAIIQILPAFFFIITVLFPVTYLFYYISPSVASVSSFSSLKISSEANFSAFASIVFSIYCSLRFSLTSSLSLP